MEDNALIFRYKKDRLDIANKLRSNFGIPAEDIHKHVIMNTFSYDYDEIIEKIQQDIRGYHICTLPNDELYKKYYEIELYGDQEIYYSPLSELTSMNEDELLKIDSDTFFIGYTFRFEEFCEALELDTVQSMFALDVLKNELDIVDSWEMKKYNKNLVEEAPEIHKIKFELLDNFYDKYYHSEDDYFIGNSREKMEKDALNLIDDVLIQKHSMSKDARMLVYNLMTNNTEHLADEEAKEILRSLMK